MKPSTYEGKTACELVQIPLDAEDLRLSLTSVHLGEEAQAEISQLRKKGHLTERDVLLFKSQVREFLTAIVTKLQKKSPLIHQLVNDMSCLTPAALVSTAADEMDNRFPRIVTHLKVCF